MAAGHDRGLAVFRAVQEGDRRALDELVGANSRWVRGVIYAQLGEAPATEDVLQRVWVRVWERAGSVRDVGTWRAWLCRVARNMARDEARVRRQERKGFVRAAELVSARQPEAPPPDGELNDAERRRLLLGAIGGLPAMYREPLVLRHLEGWNYRQIAEVLDVPPDTVETRLLRARRLLRETLDGKV